MSQKRKSPAENGAEVSLHSDFATKIVNGQIKNGYMLEIILPGTAQADPRKFYVGASNAARSLLILYLIKIGVTRAEALSAYFVLSLTQHVHKIRHEWELDIETERIPPTRYARYHLLSHVTIRIFRKGQ